MFMNENTKKAISDLLAESPNTKHMEELEGRIRLLMLDSIAQAFKYAIFGFAFMWVMRPGVDSVPYFGLLVGVPYGLFAKRFIDAVDTFGTNYEASHMISKYLMENGRRN